MIFPKNRFSAIFGGHLERKMPKCSYLGHSVRWIDIVFLPFTAAILNFCVKNAKMHLSRKMVRDRVLAE